MLGRGKSVIILYGQAALDSRVKVVQPLRGEENSTDQRGQEGPPKSGQSCTMKRKRVRWQIVGGLVEKG